MNALISNHDDFEEEIEYVENDLDAVRLNEVLDFLDAKYGELETADIMDIYPDFYRMSVVEVAYTLGHLLDPTNYEY